MGLSILVIWIVGSLILGILGRHHKFGFWGLIFCSLMLSPLIGMLIYIAGCTGVRYRHDRQSLDGCDGRSRTPAVPPKS